MIDYVFNEQQLKLKEKAHEFAVKYILPKEREYDEKAVFPSDIIEKARAEKLVNGMIPKEYGGQGYGVMERYIISEEMAWACSGIAIAMQVQDAVVIPFLLSKKEPLRKKYFKELLDGKLMALAYTEPDAGSHLTAIQTEARHVGDTYILNGTKTLISSVNQAAYALVFAKIRKPEKDVFSMFVVDMKDPGITIHESIETMGQRANVIGGFDMHDVVVKEEDMIFEEDGFKTALKGIEYNRTCCSGIAVGIARRALDESIKYAKERETYGKPIWKHQAVGQMIANMDVQIQAAQLLSWQAAKNMELNNDREMLSSYAKVFSTDAATQICSDALQIFGGNGYLKKNEVEKLYRDVKVCQIYEGTSQIHRDTIVRLLVKKDR